MKGDSSGAIACLSPDILSCPRALFLNNSNGSLYERNRDNTTTDSETIASINVSISLNANRVPIIAEIQTGAERYIGKRILIPKSRFLFQLIPHFLLMIMLFLFHLYRLNQAL